MRKILTLVISCVLMLSLLSGCVGTTVIINDCDCPGHDQNVSGDKEDQGTNDNLAEGALKTGIATLVDIKSSVSATEGEPGAIKFDVTVAAVTLDKDGVIRSCIVDGIPATVEFDQTGTVTSDVAASILSKNELGSDYGMVAWGGAVAEWDEQVKALCDFAVGKTVEELKNGAIDASGKAPAGSDLASSATIYLGGYVAAIEKAAMNAKDLGASVGDEMKMVAISTVKNSTSASEEGDANIQMEVDMAVVTAKEDVITSAMIDGLQAKVAVDQTGAIKTDLAGTILTKNELGSDYGMVAWGGAIAEWNEQAASFASYITGKTPEEVAGIAVNESFAPEDGSDLSSSVTISIGGFLNLVEKAFK